MPMQNDKSFTRFPGQLLQSLPQFPIFSGKSFEAETAEFPEHSRLDKHKRPMKKPTPTEPNIQDGASSMP